MPITAGVAVSPGVGMSRPNSQPPQAASGAQQSKEKVAVVNDRRTSLPAGSLTHYKAQSSIQEARGILAELLSQKNLPPTVTCTLKSVSALLNPSRSVPTITELLCDLAIIQKTPFIGGESISLTPEAINARRQSVYTWSTVTSASGLPQLVIEPKRSRSITGRKLTDAQDYKYSSSERKNSAPIEGIRLSDGTIFKVEEIDSNSLLCNISSKWDFPIFSFFEQFPNTILTQFAYKSFRQLNLFAIFRIEEEKFFSFFHELEMGYLDLPYHNRIHAADVLQCVTYFTQNPMPALDGADNGLSDVCTSLELMALYAAAAMHDYDHPGRTNAFLVASGDPKALLYNDRSVLENHHAAASWKLLIESKNNFVENLDSTEFKRFRYIVIEAILATDLKRHFEVLVEFDEKIGNFNWQCENDRLLLGQICIKMADINSPTKSFELHKEWTNRILEEFYCQGDDERSLGLPVSAYMDRNETSHVAKLQDSFFAHLVKPLAYSMDRAGLLPFSTSNDKIDVKNVENGEFSLLAEKVDADCGSTRSELMFNIEKNHVYWKTEMGGEEPIGQDSDDRKISRGLSEAEMETIQEEGDESAGDLA